MREKDNKFLILTALVAALGGLLFGFDTAVISGTTPFIQPYFRLNDIALGWTVSSLLVGCIVGVISSGKPGDLFGRSDDGPKMTQEPAGRKTVEDRQGKAPAGALGFVLRPGLESPFHSSLFVRIGDGPGPCGVIRQTDHPLKCLSGGSVERSVSPQVSRDYFHPGLVLDGRLLCRSVGELFGRDTEPSAQPQERVEVGQFALLDPG